MSTKALIATGRQNEYFGSARTCVLRKKSATYNVKYICMTTEEANKIVKSFSRTVIRVHKIGTLLCPLYFPGSLLEYSKEKTQLAMTSALDYAYLNNDQKTADLIKTVMAELNSFIDDNEAYTENHKVLGRKEYWELMGAVKKTKHTN